MMESNVCRGSVDAYFDREVLQGQMLEEVQNIVFKAGNPGLTVPSYTDMRS